MFSPKKKSSQTAKISCGKSLILYQDNVTVSVFTRIHENKYKNIVKIV